MNLPKVGLVVCTYLESNQKYLDECLKSIRNLNYPKELLDVVVVSSGSYVPYVNNYLSHHSPTQTHYPESINRGVEVLGDDYSHYLLLNDDAILTKNSLLKLVMDAGENMAIFQPTSTCDNGWRYHLKFQAGGTDLDRRFYRYSDLEGRFTDIMNSDSLYPPGLLMVDYVCFYATLIPKKVWDIVGPLDPKFLTGQDDIDYCRRAKAKGIPCAINLNSFIFHFGGVTADQVLTPEIRMKNIDYFTEKHGLRPDY